MDNSNKISFSAFLLCIFFCLALFNTTYKNLGTIIPSIVMLLFLIFLIFSRTSLTIDSYKYCFLLLPSLIFTVTLFSIGEISRTSYKVFILAVFFIISTSYPWNIKESKLFIKSVIFSYLIYSLYFIFFGYRFNLSLSRMHIKMLGSDIDPNVLGSLFILPTVIILYKIINGKNILLNFILYAIFTISIILTGSTGMLLAFVISNLLTVILSIYKRDKKKILVLIILILGFCVLFFIVQNNFIRYLDRATSLRNVNNLHGRYSIWIERLSLFENSPMWGYGQNLNLGRFKNMASHNTYIQVLFYSGFLGLFLFIFPILKIIYRKKDEERKILFILLIAILIPIMTLDELDNRVLWNVLILSDILSHQKDIKAVLL